MKITQDELRELFGTTIPMGVVDMLFNGDPSMTIGEFRAWLRGYAAGIKYHATVATSGTVMLGDGWQITPEGALRPTNNPVKPDHVS